MTRLWLHERALAGLALVLSMALVWRAGPFHPTTLTMLAVTAGQLASTRLPSRLRLIASYLVALALFSLTAQVVPALGLPARDDALRAIDQLVLGETPSAMIAPFATQWLTEVMSAFYLSYLVYFHVALGWALLQPRAKALRYFEPFYTALAAGMAGYYLVPAIGPGHAFPFLYRHPLAGGPIAALNAAVVERGSSVYDVFPSLHVLMTCMLLDHDRREHPQRFRFMLPVAVGLFASTIYLRYHYAIDLVAGGVVFVAVRWALRASDATFSAETGA